MSCHGEGGAGGRLTDLRAGAGAQSCPGAWPDCLPDPHTQPKSRAHPRELEAWVQSAPGADFTLVLGSHLDFTLHPQEGDFAGLSI